MLYMPQEITAHLIDGVLQQTRAGMLPHEYCGMSNAVPRDPACVDLWAAENPDFAAQLAAARKAGADALMARCVYIADRNDLKADAKKVMIEARMKAAQQWNPDKYGPQADKNPQTGISALVHMPWDQLSEANKASVNKFFGTDDD